MKTIVLVYHERLGDILRCLPIARHFASAGYDVAIECLPQYYGVFEAVSYARPTSPGRDLKARRIDLQIWPDKYVAFRASGKSWEDFVYGLLPECDGLDRSIVFDRVPTMSAVEDHLYGPQTAIVSPFGYSQTVKIAPHLICQYAFQTFGAPMRILAEERQAEACIAAGWSESLFLTARSIPDLIRMLRDARQVMTVNSAPAIICNAVRSSYWHIPSGTPQDDTITAKSKVVTFAPLV
jgi:hypothetical protein